MGLSAARWPPARGLTRSVARRKRNDVMNMPVMKRELASSYDDVVAQVPDALKSEGFGVLTEIDIQRTLKEKIQVDFRRYKILGACHPGLAHQALQNDLDVGVLLPCNVVVYENDDGGTVVSLVDPVAAIGQFGDDRLAALATEVQTKLARALQRIG